MNVHWADAALADLRAIESYIARHSAQYARGVVARLFDRSGQLTDQPLLGAAVPEYGDDALRELLEGSYRIIYRALEHQIDIVAVVHAARRLPHEL